MKFFRALNILVSSLIVLMVASSCSTSNQVATNQLIQKRKYRQGFHLNLRLNDKENQGPVSVAQADNKRTLDADIDLETEQSSSNQPTTVLEGETFENHDPNLIASTTPLSGISDNQSKDYPTKKLLDEVLIPKKTAANKTITSRYHLGGKIAFALFIVYLLAQLIALLIYFTLFITIPIWFWGAVGLWGILTVVLAALNKNKSKWGRATLIAMWWSYLVLGILYGSLFYLGLLDFGL